jgi:hypothetical protein
VHVRVALEQDRETGDSELLEPAEPLWIGMYVDGDELDALGREMPLDPDAVRSAGRPVERDFFANAHG